MPDQLPRDMSLEEYRAMAYGAIRMRFETDVIPNLWRDITLATEGGTPAQSTLALVIALVPALTLLSPEQRAMGLTALRAGITPGGYKAMTMFASMMGERMLDHAGGIQ